MICRIFAAMELGIPTKRSASGNIAKTAAPSTGPQKLPPPPMITIEMIKIDSMTVKLPAQLFF